MISANFTNDLTLVLYIYPGFAKNPKYVENGGPFAAAVSIIRMFTQTSSQSVNKQRPADIFTRNETGSERNYLRGID